MAEHAALSPAREAIHNAEDARPPRPRPPELPPGCPVVPVGMEGDIRYYLDAQGQLSSLPLDKHGRLRIMGLFGAEVDLVFDYWPRKDARGETVGWRPEDGAKQLMALAAARGIWSPNDKARGRGCWLGADGGLLVQCGTGVLAGGHWRRPGILGDQVLIARPAVMRPSPIAEPGGPDGVGAEVLELFRTWNWRRPIDPVLHLGFFGAGFLGASLPWRPVEWIVGGTSTGKSTMLKTMEQMYGGWLVKAVEPTAAGVWQTLGHDCLPIGIDEAELDGDNRRLNALVKLARACASGDRLLRGSSEGTASEYSLRSCVMFSSIRHPPLLAQDRNRIIKLHLGEMLGEQLPDLAPERLRAMGARILQRVIAGWPRLPAAITQYGIALRAVGHRNRSVDVFGTALAIADIIQNDEPVDTDSAAELAAQLVLTGLPEGDDNLSDQEAWLQFLLSTSIPLDGPGPKNPVAEWLRQGIVNDAFDEARSEADRILGNHGIKILRPKGSTDRPTHFAIANRNAGLDRLHLNTHWAGRSGALGVFVQAARDLPGSHVTTQRFGAVLDKGTAIPLELANLDQAAPRTALPLEVEP